MGDFRNFRTHHRAPRKPLCSHSCAHKKEGTRRIKMDRRKVKILKEMLGEVSSHFEEIEKFVKERLQKICSQEKISVEEVIYLLVSSLSLMKAYFLVLC